MKSPFRLNRHVAVALIYATIMLVVAYIIRGSEHAWMVTMLILCLYFVPFGMLEAQRKGTCGCLKERQQ